MPSSEVVTAPQTTSPPTTLTASLLNKGEKVHPPKDSNGVIVTLPDGKTAKLLLADLDTLKGCGLAKKILWVKVPLDNKRRPQWHKATQVK